MSRRVRTTAAELEVLTGKLPAGLRRGEQLVRKSTQRMQRDMSRVESPLNRMSGSASARGGRRRSLGGMMGSGREMLKGAAVMGGIYGIQAEVKKAKQFEEVLVDIAVRGQKNKQWVDQLRHSMVAMSNEYGIGKEQLADYVGTVIDQTGNTELAVNTLRSMTAVAFSANVPMKELAGTVVEMQSKLGLAPRQFETALGILAAQADKGKVPLSQMATFLPEVLNAAGAFGHTGIGALRDYGAVLQMAARGAGSLAEANTAMNRGMDMIISKRVAIERSLGVKLKKDGAWLQLSEIMKLISGKLAEIEKKGKKVTKIGRGGKKKQVDVENWVLDIFGIRGKKMMLPMLQQARVGFGQRVGASGGKGGLTSFEDLIASGGAGTIQKRVARKRKLSPELDAWNKSVERLKNRLHMHLLPAIKKLGDVLPTVGKALEWMIDNWKLLLVVWGSTKMIRFMGSLRALAGGGGGLGGLLGGGASTAGAATTGGTAAAGMGTVGGGGFIGGLGTATVALGALAISVAPAVAGLHELGKAYTKEGKREKLKQLRAKVKTDSSLTGNEAAADMARRKVFKQFENEGLIAKGSLGIGGGGSAAEMRAVKARQQIGVGKTDAAALRNIYMDWLDKKAADAQSGVAQFGTKRIKGLEQASEYQLGQVGLNKEMVRVLSALATTIETDRRLTTEGLREFIKKKYIPGAQHIVVNVVDPTKTAAGVTNSRRGAK